MKKIIICSILCMSTLFSSGVSANNYVGCRATSDVAFAVMMMRQAGVPMSELMEKITPDPVMEAIIMDAYNEPKYQSESMKKEAAEKFRDTIALTCYKAQGKGILG